MLAEQTVIVQGLWTLGVAIGVIVMILLWILILLYEIRKRMK